jgi:hypothetical protein
MQTNGIEDPEISPQNYSHLVFEKGDKNMGWRKDSLFNKRCWGNWMSTCRRLKLDTYVSLCTQSN